VLITSCGGGSEGGSKEASKEVLPLPKDLNSSINTSWSEDTKLIEVKIEYFNYLPEDFVASEIIVYIDSDDSSNSSSGDITIKLKKVEDCDSSNFCNVYIEDAVISSGVLDSRGYQYAVNYTSGETSVTLIVHRIISQSVITELSDDSFSVNVSTSIYDGYDSELTLSNDYFPGKSTYQSVINGELMSDSVNDYEGNDNFADIKSVTVTSYIN
jgi:hypothetical protein